VNAAFFMGLFFLISGYFVPRSFDRKGPLMFLRDRFKRIGLPLLFFSLLIIGPINYLMQPVQMSLGAFIRGLYESSWQGLFWHLWFLAHLLLYGAVYALWRLATRRRPTQASPIRFVPNHWAILSFTLVLALASWLVRIWYPIDRWEPLFFIIPAEIAHLPQYVGLFALGIMAYRGDWFRRLPARLGWLWLGIGLVASTCIYWYILVGSRFLPRLTAMGGFDWRSLVYSTWEAFICVGLCIGLVTLFRRFFAGQPGALLTAMAGAAYAAYILHALLVVGIQMGLVEVALPALAKFALVTVLATVLSYGLGYLLRRIPGVRAVL
jgi:surface polysaccharide O-acyltransferase-like enzyme